LPPRPRRRDLKKALSLRERAVALLARREHTRAELARKLAPHADDRDEIAPLLDDLVLRKLLSDDRYAEARAHTLARKFGTARIEHELRAKGWSACDREGCDRDAGHRARKRARRGRSASARRPQAPPSVPSMRFLQGRGFSFDVIRRVVAGTEDD
jgi:regulatory protein